MKYNKSEIMKRAWEIFRKSMEMFKKSAVTFSNCLHEAWAEAKGNGMKGSGKQTAWAMKIRKEAVEALERKLEKQERFLSRSGKEKYAKRIEGLKAAKARMEEAHSASWWIDRRGFMSTDFAEEATGSEWV